MKPGDNPPVPPKTRKKIVATRGRPYSRPKRAALNVYDRLRLRKAVRATLIGVSERTLGTGTKLSPRTTRRLAEGTRLLNALAEVIDADFIAEWLVIPNDAFGCLKPLEVIDRGEVDQIWQMIYRLRSGEPT